MSNIDYIKNVQVTGLLNIGGNTNNSFIYKANNFPVDRPPNACIVRQVNFINEEDPIVTTSYMYHVWSDIINDNIASFVSNNGIASVAPNTTIKLTNPIAGQMIFQLNAMVSTGLVAEDSPCIITLNLDFIRYK